jgi:hypothetical protein
MKFIFIAFLIVGFCAWAPWVTPEMAQTHIVGQFDTTSRAQNPLFDGSVCTLTSLTDIHKVAFGYDGHVVYDCEVSGHGESDVTYTFYGSVIGAPSK